MAEAPYDFIAATTAARDRQRQVSANFDEVKELHAAIRADPGAVRRNRLLLAQAQALLDANDAMQALNGLVIARYAEYLAGGEAGDRG